MPQSSQKVSRQQAANPRLGKSISPIHCHNEESSTPVATGPYQSEMQVIKTRLIKQLVQFILSGAALAKQFLDHLRSL